MTIRWLSAPLLLLHTVLIGCTVSCGTEARVNAQDVEARFEVASVNAGGGAPWADGTGSETLIAQLRGEGE
jgi:hypothetical protein